MSIETTPHMQTDFFEDENQKENDDDIKKISNKDFSQAVLSGNDWTTETVINQINKGNIQLNPSFQRRDAWDKDRKSKFIESLIIGLPVPQLVLAESKEKKGAYIVLDGKQRLLSIRQFSANNDDEKFEQLHLKNLDIRSDLNGLNLNSLKSDSAYEDDVSTYENQPIRTVVIKNWPNEDFLYHIFLRLNTGSVSLSPQELRQALHPGPFVSYIDEASANSQSLREILKISKPDFRMRDTELLLRFISFKNFLESYSGTLKDFLDKSCKCLNSTWKSDEQKIKDQVISFEEAHKAVKLIFGDNSYKKWIAGNYESRFNRSIFDIMILSMIDEGIRNKAIANKNKIEDKFKSLCAENQSFKTSIETTTKSITATQTRISTWFSALNDALGVELLIPTINSKK